VLLNLQQHHETLGDESVDGKENFTLIKTALKRKDGIL